MNTKRLAAIALLVCLYFSRGAVLRLHLARPDLWAYPVFFEVYCTIDFPGYRT